MNSLRVVAFSLFAVSGFCGLVYQIVWLRLAFASFGIVTPVLSVVLSAFMAGLALGSWLAGRFAAPLAKKPAAGAIAYGLVEWGIGCGALVVPWLFTVGENALLGSGDWSSAGYLGTSALILGGSILLFATLMGATFPLMMAFLRANLPGDAGTFSFLYLGNVIGAMLGAATTAALWIECFGFHGTLAIAAVGNGAIGLVALLLPKLAGGRAAANVPANAQPMLPATGEPTTPRLRLWLLFATGFTSMAMEVAWTRAFTPVLYTTIYAFAAVLTVYLAATWIGSALYRRHLRQGRPAAVSTLLGLLFPAALLPLVLNDPALHESVAIVLGSIVPISALLGYLTPQLIDEHARGEPQGAGLAYAVNVLGCILGPLLAGYFLLPAVGVKWTLLLSAAVYPAFLLQARPTRASLVWRSAVAAGAVALLAGLFAVRTHEDPSLHAGCEVRRDHVATVVSFGEGRKKRMLVNGVGITELTDLTKVMAHLPLAVREKPPESTLVICFGMGTTFRSLTTWGGRTTAVELVPSVPEAFPFYWHDAAEVKARPGAQIVVDDGRRFLRRTTERFDLITLDPPPPVEAGGSSLLYSSEFYRVVRQRLSPTGLLQQWFPGGEDSIMRAVVNTVVREFPHVVLFKAFESHGDMKPNEAGIHILAADWPITVPTIVQAIARMPEAAKRDMMEWHPELTLEIAWDFILKNRIEMPVAMPAAGSERLGITDDRPYNEYFWLRRQFGGAGTFLEHILPAK
ncbi:MAG: fused MFS/spermidine synthase [Planctomycetota bacterium]